LPKVFSVDAVKIVCIIWVLETIDHIEVVVQDFVWNTESKHV